MSPPHASPLDRCHHPLVRDLAWLLAAPDLLAMPWPGRPTPAALGFADPEHLSDWLTTQEAAPEALEIWVGGALKGRMGLYHERLWQFLLASAPGTELLAHNLRIHRGKQTLGELDLLYRRRGDRDAIHLEVAIKYYLGLVQGPGRASDQARWIGPGGADSLASKREHLHRHQLRLTEQPETREAILALLAPDAVGADRPRPLAPLECRVAMPGVLFYPWQHPLPLPREASPAHLRGTWLPWSAWHAYRHGLPAGTRGAWLHKPHWLALPRCEALLPLRDLEHQLADYFRHPNAPVQIALCLPDNDRHDHDSPETGWRRLFLVADDWPRQVPLPPLQRPDAAPPPASSARLNSAG